LCRQDGVIGSAPPLASSPDHPYVELMLGRVLFVLVCLIIATGLLLPVYPAEVATPKVASAQDMLVADIGTPGCRDCASAARVGAPCQAGCPCGRAAPATGDPARACLHLTVYLIVRPLPASGPRSEPQLLAPKLPTI
jgi:hypothetical protein